MSEWIQSQLPRILEVRELAGWRPTTLDSGSFCARCMCVMAELRELEDEFEKLPSECKPGAIDSECADVALYLIVILNDLNPGVLRQVDESNQVWTWPRGGSWTCSELVARVRKYVIYAWEAWRQDRHEDIYLNLRNALEAAMVMGKGLDVDLPKAVAEKTEINSKRGRRHGLKHPDT